MMSGGDLGGRLEAACVLDRVPRQRGISGVLITDEMAHQVKWRACVMARQAAELKRLANNAAGSDEAEPACLYWLGALRQAQRYLRGLDTRPGEDAEKVGHRSTLLGFVEQARSALGDADPTVVEQAHSRLGIRVAVVGKGGAGKSFISGTLARLLAREGRRVLAVDFDTNPGLAYSLGVPATVGALPEEVVMEHPGASYGWGLRDGMVPMDVVDRHGYDSPDGVKFLSLGKIANIDKDAPKRTVVALCELVADFGQPDWDVIGDMEAGPTTPYERYHSFADSALVVVTPTWVSGMTARRLLRILDDVRTCVITNQVGDQRSHLGLAAAVRIPLDPEAAEAARQGLAPLDACPDSPAVAAIARLACSLINQEVTT